MRTSKALILAAALLLAPALQATAAPTPSQRCEDKKLRATARFVSCRLVADATFAIKHDATRRDTAYLKCTQKLSDAYAKAEKQYASACPTAGDGDSVERFLGSFAVKARDWTAGDLAGPLVFERLSASGQTACWAGGSSTSSPGAVPCAGTSQDGDSATGAPLAFADNGDGTITDGNTGLQWEKKSNDGSLHDLNDTYPWASTCSDAGQAWCTRDADCTGGATCSGTTAFEWIDALNASRFAGHDDWRLPNVRELVTIVDYGSLLPAVAPEFNSACGLYSSGNPGCTVASCSCTNTAELYWSSSTLDYASADATSHAWQMYLGYGYHRYGPKTDLAAVRAVRGGS